MLINVVEIISKIGEIVILLVLVLVLDDGGLNVIIILKKI